MIPTTIIKLPFQTRHFNKNQTVFVVFGTGARAAYVRGKFRGKHRWVNAWIKWNDKNPIEYKQINLSEEDYNRIFN